MSAPRPNLKDHSIEGLRERFAARGIAPYRAEQIAAWLYARGVEDPSRMTDLPQPLRERLAAEWSTRALGVESVARSADGTTKAVLVAADGARIESVLIPEEGRTTLCLSTQVGCPLECSFCATATLGFMRELLPPGGVVTNAVFMGMGEPLLNLDAVVEAVRLMIHPRGFGMAPRRVTVSTVGLVPRIGPLLERVPVNLAVSLHATTDEVRDRLVPLNRRFPLASLLGALRRDPRITPRRPVFFEYTLIAGVNDSAADARRLPGLLRGVPCKLNLIPMNPHPGSAAGPPAEAGIDRFLRELAGAGMTVTLRRPRGADIDAACGQLALAAAPAGVKAPASGDEESSRGPAECSTR